MLSCMFAALFASPNMLCYLVLENHGPVQIRACVVCAIAWLLCVNEFNGLVCSANPFEILCYLTHAMSPYERAFGACTQHSAAFSNKTGLLLKFFRVLRRVLSA